jgi:hypothetical protein
MRRALKHSVGRLENVILFQTFSQDEKTPILKFIAIPSRLIVQSRTSVAHQLLRHKKNHLIYLLGFFLSKINDQKIINFNYLLKAITVQNMIEKSMNTKRPLIIVKLS